MNIYDKIEEIRHKPDHIRIRYVWSCVAVSMVIVIAIWALSLKSRQYQTQTEGQVAGQASIFDELKAQKENLSQYQQEMSAAKGNLEKNLQEVQEQQVTQDMEGFPEGVNAADAIPATNPADLFQ